MDDVGVVDNITAMVVEIKAEEQHRAAVTVVNMEKNRGLQIYRW